MYITLKTGKNKCELWLTTEGEKSRGREQGGEGEEKTQTSANVGEIGISITSDSEHDFPFQPWLQRETTVLCEVSNFW